MRNETSYDFSGWATKNDILCKDGRTIRRNAFRENDGKKVPICWMHRHDDPGSVLGHAILENRDEGVYFFGKFNNTKDGLTAKELVRHKDVDSVSIFANELKQDSSMNVFHGDIKELSLVLAGANSGAKIQEVLCHSEFEGEDCVEIRSNYPLYFPEDEELVHDDMEEEDDEMSDESMNMEEVLDTLTPVQAEAVTDLLEGLLAEAAENDDDDDDVEIDFESELEDDDDDDDYEEDDTMMQSAFDTNNMSNTLSHADEMEIIKDAQNNHKSLKQVFQEHTDSDAELYHAAINRSYTMPDGNTRNYGVSDIGQLFPDARALNNAPEFITRKMDWVTKVLNGVKHLPWSRVKTMWADVTEDAARALGYQTGHYKKEEVFSLLKRTTQPTTVYKKQRMDRDDKLDITSFDVVAWIKAEMRMMLDEELARAFMIGDGREISSEDKIDENCIVPIAKDTKSGVFGVPEKVNYTFLATDDADTKSALRARAFIKTVKKTRKHYRGSGNPALYCSEDLLTDMLLLEDSIGRPLYDTIEKLKTALRVSDIVTFEQMEGYTVSFPADGADGNFDFTSNDTVTKGCLGIIVNLIDYGVGTDKGGNVSMFDQFDIDYNQEKYLIETRCSGALMKPKSALIYGDYGVLASSDVEDDDNEEGNDNPEVGA